MKLLADENVHREIVTFLRAEGHDVQFIVESAPSEMDTSIVLKAWREERIVVTRGLDFGELIVRQKMQCRGILLLRFQTKTGEEYVERFKTL